MPGRVGSDVDPPPKPPSHFESPLSGSPVPSEVPLLSTRLLLVRQSGAKRTKEELRLLPSGERSLRMAFFAVSLCLSVDSALAAANADAI